MKRVKLKHPQHNGSSDLKEQTNTVSLGPGVVQWQSENLEHKRYEYDLNENSNVYDIGSYKREFANEIEKRYHCKVKTFDAIDNNAAWLHDGNIILSGNGNTMSAFTNNSTFKKQYKCVDIARVIREDEKQIDLMKINIEGGEYGLLSHIFAQGLMPRIDNIQVQFHAVTMFNYKLVYEVLSRQLRLTHHLQWRYEFCWESWKRTQANLFS